VCVSAALEAIKETVVVPWKVKEDKKVEEVKMVEEEPFVDDIYTPETMNTPLPDVTDASNPPSGDTSSTSSASQSAESAATSAATSLPGTPAEPAPIPPRVLYSRHFAHALLQVSPSASESQTSLKDLRQWNTVFGTGARK
jgi:hypothetical protein